ncbi:stage VI sporulation protein D [Oceanobacillus damuensis]|uniref:stage VI sporulation protein D n=1 Tax=Oceanobacillus damuensis TaxID=937928 RepID=UPI00082FCA47|nr:stage VI sporulation protein D [Oceanobacillus damuensis]
MTGDSKAFTFELEESLFFEKGQEVAEMRAIALEPEISIQSYDEYISIKGIIELRGEYERSPSAESEDEVLDFDDFQAKRYVEKVIEEDGTVVFSHSFPVEISVPPYRVADLNDVTVNIESFDYELPESGKLKLYASIEIHGINSEEEKPRTEKEEQVLDEFADDEEDTFEFEIRKQKEEFAEDREESKEAETENPPEVIEQENQDIQAEETEGEAMEKEDPDRWKVKSQTLAEFFNKLPEEQEDKAEDMEELVAQESEVNSTDDNSTSDGEQSVEVHPSGYEEQTMEDATYLSDIFRSTEEESFTKMRLCIVQDQDTIESIAQRFSISPLQLIKHNDLDTDFEVYEGQLLYIPHNS